ncbi:ABC transporter permease [Pseudomonas syringae pv. cilantro]|uniref:ABC transporter permease n=2 Tax=Pseudomonas syringae group TaxID=136849 RepID=A0A0N0XC58_PSESX|nr:MULTISPECIES: ABC transporter permease subunit [Pseudomonas syringae group]KPC31495.1 ABC transporter permease [Pseudomonas syringae pv. cilantro]KPW80253.1 ABC transporter permease [Pseudomonas syringae pv. coriandricola]RMN13767.1 ABC transporter permease [Pseudomonas syringae pv. coriandricola]
MHSMTEFGKSLRTPRFVRAGARNAYVADGICVVILAVLIALLWYGVGQMLQPLAVLDSSPVTLDPARLPEYALRTTLRMFIALAASLIFTFIVATLAAKSRKAEQVIIPALDILQSVPVLGFLTFTVTFFMGLFPGRQLGVECAAIFAIFTSQAWNIAFSFYQSLRTVPNDLSEVSRQFGLSPVLRFTRLELPFAIPGLVWNMMMSMSGGWFFVVACEAISVGDTTVNLPGIGSWLALAVEQKNLPAIGWAVGAMALVILAYDQLLFRPVVAWADKFRFEQTASSKRPRSWVYSVLGRSRLAPLLGALLAAPWKGLMLIDWRVVSRFWKVKPTPWVARLIDYMWLGMVMAACLTASLYLFRFIEASLGLSDMITAFGLGLATMLRVIVLIVVASLIWVPVGVWIGLRPVWAERLQPIAQFMAAFPANVLFPFAVIAIVGLHLNPDIWLSPLMVLGTQWYILFNVIAGASALPTDLREAASMFNMRGWQWWRRVALPGVFPYYVTGALTASGGSWNASIVAEAVSWGDQHLQAAGLGSHIASATQAGDFPRVALGIAVMSVFVIAFNRLLWRPLYGFAERRLSLV